MGDARSEAFWQRFLQKAGRPADTALFDVFHFELTEKLANELLALVLEGEKCATASSEFRFAAEGNSRPKVGDLSIVTDWEGTPRCVIETTAVTVLPFREMTFEICSREGEDDTLESWQRGHVRFFTDEGKQMGYTFDWDMPVVFEDFEVVYTE